jgi:hypothetical protein
MGPTVRQDYIQGADLTSGARTAPRSCAAAVRDDHAGYLRDHELVAERAAQRAVVRAFAAGRVTFRTAARQAIVVAHLKTRGFLGLARTTITARLARSASPWTVLTVSESPSGAVSPPPPIPTARMLHERSGSKTAHPSSALARAERAREAFRV